MSSFLCPNFCDHFCAPRAFPSRPTNTCWPCCATWSASALRADLVERAEQWRWGSLYRRIHGTAEERALLADPPVPLGRRWRQHVNKPQNEAELEAIRRCVARGQPFGSDAWRRKVARQLGLEYTFRPRGRPRKQPSSTSGAKHPPN